MDLRTNLNNTAHSPERELTGSATLTKIIYLRKPEMHFDARGSDSGAFNRMI